MSSRLDKDTHAVSGGLTDERILQQASAHVRATWNAIAEVDTAHYDEWDPFGASYIRSCIGSMHKTVLELVQLASQPRAHLKAIETLTKALESQSRDLLEHGRTGTRDGALERGEYRCEDKTHGKTGQSPQKT